MKGRLGVDDIIAARRSRLAFRPAEQERMRQGLVRYREKESYFVLPR